MLFFKMTKNTFETHSGFGNLNTLYEVESTFFGRFLISVYYDFLKRIKRQSCLHILFIEILIHSDFVEILDS